MARPISDEELQLKKRARRRLVGAIVLVTAVAVILPMVLDSEPKPVSQNVDIQIPPPDAGEFKPKGVRAGYRNQRRAGNIRRCHETRTGRPPGGTNRRQCCCSACSERERGRQSRICKSRARECKAGGG